MRKVLFILVVVAFSFTTVQSQNIGHHRDMKAGISASLPLGDFSEVYSFGLQADFVYLFQLDESFKVGPMASLFYYKGKSIGDSEFSMSVSDALFLPIGGHARYIYI